jgi:hypothetical protein
MMRRSTYNYKTINNKLLNVLRFPIEIVNCLQVKTIDVFLTIVFRIGLLPYLRLTTTGMKQDTLIEYKEVVVCDQESGHVNLNYNALTTNHTKS